MGISFLDERIILSNLYLAREFPYSKFLKTDHPLAPVERRRLNLFIVNECFGYRRLEYKMSGIRLICVSLKKEEATTHLRFQNNYSAVHAMPAGFAYFKQIEDRGLRFSSRVRL